MFKIGLLRVALISAYNRRETYKRTVLHALLMEQVARHPHKSTVGLAQQLAIIRLSGTCRRQCCQQQGYQRNTGYKLII